MKTLEEMIEILRQGSNVVKMIEPTKTNDYEIVLSLLIELKQRREQDLSLEMVECMKCALRECQGCKIEVCPGLTDWLAEQEARLKDKPIT